MTPLWSPYSSSHKIMTIPLQKCLQDLSPSFPIIVVEIPITSHLSLWWQLSLWSPPVSLLPFLPSITARILFQKGKFGVSFTYIKYSVAASGSSPNSILVIKVWVHVAAIPSYTCIHKPFLLLTLSPRPLPAPSPRPAQTLIHRNRNIHSSLHMLWLSQFFAFCR